MKRLICALLFLLFAVGCVTEGPPVQCPPPKVVKPFKEISDDTVALLLQLFSLAPEIRENMYNGQPMPFDREKIRGEFFDYAANAEMDDSDRKQLFMVLAYIFSDRLLSDREESIMRDMVTYFRVVALQLPLHEREQINKVIKLTEARLDLDVRDRERRR